MWPLILVKRSLHGVGCGWIFVFCFAGNVLQLWLCTLQRVFSFQSYSTSYLHCACCCMFFIWCTGSKARVHYSLIRLLLLSSPNPRGTNIFFLAFLVNERLKKEYFDIFRNTIIIIFSFLLRVGWEVWHHSYICLVGITLCFFVYIK